MLSYILPEAVIGSLTLVLVFSSSDDFLWALVSFSEWLFRRLNCGNLFIIPFSWQAKKKKKVILFSNIFMNIQLSTIVEKQKSKNKTLTCYIPKDKTTRAGFLEWSLCQFCAEIEHVCLETRTHWIHQNSAYSTVGPQKDKFLNKRRKFIFHVHSIYGYLHCINARNHHGFIKLRIFYELGWIWVWSS